MLHRKPQRNTDYTGRCGNCHARIGEDAYCRFCGTKAGEGSFSPFEENMQCVYGPPPAMRKHTCTVCGYAWESVAMIDREKFCPQCGGAVTAEVSERDPWETDAETEPLPDIAADTETDNEKTIRPF